MSGCFVIGTDTQVGKTWVSTLLIEKMAKKGIRVAVHKPFEAGPETPTDAERLWKATGRAQQMPSYVCSYHFQEPLAPAQAATKSNQRISLEKLAINFQKAQQEGDFLLVEGCGGLLVPLLPQAPEFCIEDLALKWQLPIILIARAGLGTLNHTLLTQKRCLQMGLQLCAIVLNQATQCSLAQDPSLNLNPTTLKKLCSIPVLGPLPFSPENAGKNKVLNAHLEEILKILLENNERSK